ncbi:MAG: hypothetical protein HFH85_11965 [Lachnospiraceae bacterium]|nr:hypothetical protein [Lachnospiraceae bacterium]
MRIGEGVYDTGQVRHCIMFAEKYGEEHSASDGSTEGILGRDYMFEERAIASPLALADILEYYGKDAVLMGYPGMEGGKVIHCNLGAVSISKSSGRKEGAWAFIRFLLGREYQLAMEGTGVPLLREAYEAEVAYYQKPVTYQVYLPEAGGIITVERNHTLPRSMSEMDAMSDEQVRLLDSLAEESTIDIWEAEPEAVSIIMEGSESYYRGDKEIEQVLEVIQSRLNVYRGERK